MKSFSYYNLGFCGIVNSKYVLTIRFKNGYSIGIDKQNLKLIHARKYQN